MSSGRPHAEGSTAEAPPGGAKPNASRELELEAALRRKDRGLGQGVFYALTVFFCRVVFITFFDGRVFGVERFPTGGPLVVASNHQSLLDPAIVGLIQDRSSCYLAKEGLFQVPLFGRLIREYNAFPIPRESVASRWALELSIRILEAGRCLVLFPEGTRSRDGRIQPLRRGLALIVKRAGARVVPAIVWGARRCWPRGAPFPRPGKIRVQVGEPLEIQKAERSESFMDRLAGTYRQLAIEAGAVELIRDESLVEVGESGHQEAPPAPSHEKESSSRG